MVLLSYHGDRQSNNLGRGTNWSLNQKLFGQRVSFTYLLKQSVGVAPSNNYSVCSVEKDT